MRGVLPTTPLDFVDLLFDFQGFEVVEFWLVGLELCVELVLARLLLYVGIEISTDSECTTQTLRAH